MTIQWNEHLSTSIEWQDKEHKELISKFNYLYEKIAEKSGDSAVAEVVNFLDYFILHHFNHEETQMEETQYPELNYHREQHLIFNQNFSSIKEKFDHEGESHELADLVLNKMLEWFINHIMTVDKSLGVFLKEYYSD